MNSRQPFTVEITPDTDLTRVVSTLATLYARDLRDGIGDDLLQAAAKPGMTEDDLDDHLSELCDSSNNGLTFVAAARCYLAGSDNPDAYMDEFGAPAPSVTAAATLALTADVRETYWDRAVEIMEQVEATDSDTEYQPPHREDLRRSRTRRAGTVTQDQAVSVEGEEQHPKIRMLTAEEVVVVVKTGIAPHRVDRDGAIDMVPWYSRTVAVWERQEKINEGDRYLDPDLHPTEADIKAWVEAHTKKGKYRPPPMLEVKP